MLTCQRLTAWWSPPLPPCGTSADSISPPRLGLISFIPPSSPLSSLAKLPYAPPSVRGLALRLCCIVAFFGPALFSSAPRKQSCYLNTCKSSVYPLSCFPPDWYRSLFEYKKIHSYHNRDQDFTATEATTLVAGFIRDNTSALYVLRLSAKGQSGWRKAGWSGEMVSSKWVTNLRGELYCLSIWNGTPAACLPRHGLLCECVRDGERRRETETPCWLREMPLVVTPQTWEYWLLSPTHVFVKASLLTEKAAEGLWTSHWREQVTKLTHSIHVSVECRKAMQNVKGNNH